MIEMKIRDFEVLHLLHKMVGEAQKQQQLEQSQLIGSIKPAVPNGSIEYDSLNFRPPNF